MSNQSSVPGSNGGSGNNGGSNRIIKVILLGDASVGKTSIRSQYIHHLFSNAYKATIGGDYLTTKVNDTILQIWDTAGQERFNSISRTFYRGSDIAIVVHDITNSNSFHNLNKWIQNFLENCHVATPSIMIVGNKLDKIDLRQVSLRQAREFGFSNLNLSNLIDDINQDIIEISAKNYIDVEKLFLRVSELGLKKLNENTTLLTFDNIDITTDNSNNSVQKKYNCC
ncbi:hypothetical protein PACTADRAFT_50733 [Pachysolen tannophilus NRRL Y-2460]|uniref:Uncharacterized protein n=1 Tax=Pachysolen tannophilus NRRL Y-2460 TaxID=669874 RepID=A0A1E4TT05_PACTA|nr:hypothetical protein PACTADRAFT_50733 [Pachysolen tannophilus NRRL Y-2460]